MCSTFRQFTALTCNRAPASFPMEYFSKLILILFSNVLLKKIPRWVKFKPLSYGNSPSDNSSAPSPVDSSCSASWKLVKSRQEGIVWHLHCLRIWTSNLQFLPFSPSTECASRTLLRCFAQGLYSLSLHSLSYLPTGRFSSIFSLLAPITFATSLK